MSLTANKKIFLGVISLIIIMAAVLLLMGREPICTCGYIKLWYGVVVSSQNSQHLFDWYTFTHIIHGLGFYLLLSLLKNKLSVWQRLLLAVGLEAGWEILENTNLVINHYRTATISLDYYGDSVINSIGDVIAMIIGFVFASRQPVWQSIALFILIELMLLIGIRDNLTINIIMLVHPIEAIRLWQASS